MSLSKLARISIGVFFLGLAATNLVAQGYIDRDLTVASLLNTGPNPFAIGTPAYYGSTTINIATFRDNNDNLWQICSTNNGATWQYQQVLSNAPGTSRIDPIATYNPSTHENPVVYYPVWNVVNLYLTEAKCAGIGQGNNANQFLNGYSAFGNAPPPALISSGSTDLVYYTGSNGHIWRYLLSGGNWQPLDLWTVVSPAPPQPQGGIGAAYLGSSEVVDYVYQDFNMNPQNRIERIYRTSGWFDNDLTGAASAVRGPAIFSGSPSPNLALYSSSTINIVAYLDTTGDISELYTGSGAWHYQDLMGLSHAPGGSAVGRPSLAYTSQYHEIAYRDSQGHVNLIYNAGSGWQHIDFALSPYNFPVAAGDPSLAIIGSNSAIVYVDTNGHVQEIYN